ncbi:gamma-glutamylcyclotransferase [Alteromonas lipolytica]|uniref:Gamma-glutamylcyclotransferase AIG2-like domain-containing protein n=1 Tax=Alteromonas lipolytica TaxID=1856405 RepID=A0A1E8FCN1_9ALTE|nr:gamma-glutamylcyclotransferase [Alteromonas lipolytica]OFI33692.1 hypothetical protein BFC17_19115 [Alteromonas lipolytica]GGF69297.1 gamma-glutamylcyclotransferase [Alteromonas lipolytica]
MKTLAQLQQWMQAISEPHIVLGYGSLMSGDSRSRHSGIPHDGIEVEVYGFERGWVTRSEPEQQTYVGAYKKDGAWLNAQLVPTHLDPALQQREQDYRFTPVTLEQLHFELSAELTARLTDWLLQRDIWICETLKIEPASAAYPVHQTYIDTCLGGCLELGGSAAANRFIASTTGWQHHRVNDRSQPRYPRAAVVSQAHVNEIDALLENT